MKWITSLLLGSALALSASSASASGGAGALPDASINRPSQVLNYWHDNYYYNHFYSELKCKAWEKRITNPNDSAYIPGFINFFCHREGGEPKWSMNVYRD